MFLKKFLINIYDYDKIIKILYHIFISYNSFILSYIFYLSSSKILIINDYKYILYDFY